VRLFMAKKAGWKENQQKQTGVTTQESREQSKDITEMVAVKMRTAYRDIAKPGDIVEFDAEKAAELVRLNRAEYVLVKGGDIKMDENKTDGVVGTEEVVDTTDTVQGTEGAEASSTEVKTEEAVEGENTPKTEESKVEEAAE